MQMIYEANPSKVYKNQHGLCDITLGFLKSNFETLSETLVNAAVITVEIMHLR